VRNAAAHDNKIDLTNKDKERDLEWRGFEITPDMEGDQLLTLPAGYIWQSEPVSLNQGYLEAGDVLALTTDVLKILIDESDTYNESNVIGLSLDKTPEDFE
jgi:hypothetical protein